MNNNTQLPTGPIIGVHPAVRDGVERVAYLDGDLLRCNTDVEFTSSPPPGPVLYRTKHTRVEIADEMVTEKLIKRQRAFNSRRHQYIENLVLKALFEVINISARDRLVQHLDNLGEQRGQFVVRKRGLTVAGRQRHLDCGDRCFSICAATAADRL